MRWATNRCLPAFAVLLVMAGIFARVLSFTTSDPQGVNGDLLAVHKVWEDLTTDELWGGPSVRINQYGFALLLGLVQGAFDCDIAHSAKYISFFCSIGGILSVGLLAYALGGRLLEVLSASAIVAMSKDVVYISSTAQSESLFIFVCTSASALLLLYWRHGKAYQLALAVPLLALTCAIRGTGLIHVVGLAGALTLAWILEGEKRALSKRRLAIVLAASLTALSIFFAARSMVVRATSERYIARDGKAPIFPSYTTYAVWDGIKLGPYGVHNAEKAAERQRAKKSVDPATGKVRSAHVVHGDSVWELIRGNLGTYIRHYAVGVRMTAVKFVTERYFNLVGGIPLLVGTAFLIRRRQWLILLFVLGWISVYLFVVPGLSLHNRIVWPACFALMLPAVFFFAWMARAMVGWTQKEPSGSAYRSALACLGLVTLLFVIAGRDVPAAASWPRNFTSADRVAVERMLGGSRERISVYASTAAFRAFGTPSPRYIQMPYNAERAVQFSSIEKHRPQYVYLYGPYERHWKEVFETVRTVMGEPNDLFTAESIWRDDRSEVWRLTYRSDR